MKPGFKQTEVGVIPEEWELTPLSQEIEALDAGVSVNSVNDKIGSYTHDFAVLKTSSIADGQFLPHESKVIEPSDVARARLNPRKDSIIISRMNTSDLVGECGFVFSDFPNLFLPDRLWMTRNRKGSDINAKWLTYLLSSKPYKSRIKGFATGTSGSMKNIAKDALLSMLIPFPKSAEQHTIATALSDVDALLGVLDRLIAKKRDLKQAAMQQLLTGQTRLPGFHGEWEVKAFSDVAFLRRERIDPRRTDVHDFCIELEHIESGSGQVLRSTSTGAQSSLKSVFHTGDVLFGKLRAYLRKYWLATRSGICSTEIWVFVPREGVIKSDFLFQIIQTDEFIEAASNSYGTHMPRSDWNVVKNLELKFPSLPEQTAIASVLMDMDAELTTLEQRRDKTRALKQAMMQELLTGRIRLVKPNAAAEVLVPEQQSNRQANVHFTRSVLAAEIIDRLHDQPTFGHVKFEKMLFLVERLCDIDTGSTYHRQAAGPYDNRALRSIDSQLRKQQWFDAQKVDQRYQYLPMKNRGGHKRYFERYFPKIGGTFEKILETFKTQNTERCEIVATLLAAWSDLVRESEPVTDDRIVGEVLNNWHESKQRIAEERWRKALAWMRKENFVPKAAASRPATISRS